MAKELSAQIAKYESIQDVLEADFIGEWVVVYDEEFIGAYTSFEAAAEDAVEKFGSGPYLIRQVGAPAMILPPSMWYRPVYADD